MAACSRSATTTEHAAVDARDTASGRSISWSSISIRSRPRSRGGADFATCIENIDIGGPAMIRAAAKNHADVTVVVDPGDYAGVLAELDATRRRAPRSRCASKLAAKAYARTAAYDAAISNWFAERARGKPRRRTAPSAASSPSRCATARTRTRRRRSTARRERRPGVATARQLQGKQLSYNNINDTDAAYECVGEFDPGRTAACVIVKHANPCGVAEGASLADAYRKALACDPVSAFGGIVAFNRTLDAEAARAITEIFTEVIIAPDASEEAIAIVGAKKNLRLLRRRRPARSARAGHAGEIGRRRLAGAVARQRGRRRHDAQGRDPARADQRRARRPRALPSASPST